MFSGSWKESSMNTIELEIPDQNIDIEGNCHHNYYYVKMIKNITFLSFWQKVFSSNLVN